MRLPLLVLLLLAMSAGGLTADASITIQNPKLEQYRGVVEKAGIRDWPVAYRGHRIHVYASYTASAVKGNSSECWGAAGPPGISYTLVYDASQFYLDPDATEYRVNVTSTNTTWITRAELHAVLVVRWNASVFEVEDETGNYTREQVYIVWTITRYYYVDNNGTCMVDSTSTTVRDYPDPRYLRLYARQPSYGLTLYSIVYSGGTECYWGNATLGVRLENPGTGLPGPWSPEWQEIAELRPGQLIVEGLTISIDVRGLQSNKSMAGASWSGDLYAPLSPGQYLELNLSVVDTGMDRSVVVYPEARAVWDQPQGPTVGPVSVGPSRAGLPWGWVTVWDAPATTVYASNSTTGQVYSVQGPWPARLCLPPGSWELRCPGCIRLWIHVDEPVNVSMIEEPPSWGGTVAPRDYRSLILAVATVMVLLYLPLWLLLRE